MDDIIIDKVNNNAKYIIFINRTSHLGKPKKLL